MAIPCHTEGNIEGTWLTRFRKQTDIFRWGHIYARMQEERIREAKRRGELPEDYPENEEQLGRMDPAKFEAMMPAVKKIRFDPGVDRCDGVCFGAMYTLPEGHGLEK